MRNTSPREKKSKCSYSTVTVLNIHVNSFNTLWIQAVRWGSVQVKVGYMRLHLKLEGTRSCFAWPTLIYIESSADIHKLENCLFLSPKLICKGNKLKNVQCHSASWFYQQERIFLACFVYNTEAKYFLPTESTNISIKSIKCVTQWKVHNNGKIEWWVK